MADQEPPLPENLAALIGATDSSTTREPDYRLAWVELGGYVRTAAQAGRQLDAANLLDYMQELHERYGLPPEHAPTREI